MAVMGLNRPGAVDLRRHAEGPVGDGKFAFMRCSGPAARWRAGCADAQFPRWKARRADAVTNNQNPITCRHAALQNPPLPKVSARACPTAAFIDSKATSTRVDRDRQHRCRSKKEPLLQHRLRQLPHRHRPPGPAGDRNFTVPGVATTVLPKKTGTSGISRLVPIVPPKGRGADDKRTATAVNRPGGRLHQQGIAQQVTLVVQRVMGRQGAGMVAVLKAIWEKVKSWLCRVHLFLRRHQCLRGLLILLIAVALAALWAVLYAPDKLRQLALKIQGRAEFVAAFLPARLPPRPTSTRCIGWSRTGTSATASGSTIRRKAPPPSRSRSSGSWRWSVPNSRSAIPDLSGTTVACAGSASSRARSSKL